MPLMYYACHLSAPFPVPSTTLHHSQAPNLIPTLSLRLLCLLEYQEIEASLNTLFRSLTSLPNYITL